MTAIAENARLRGQVEVLRGQNGEASPRGVAPVLAESVAMPAPSVPTPLVSASVAAKPVHTWAAVVESRTAESSEDVVKKVLNEVGPSLGVRVHELKALKKGAILRTPSLAERDQVVKNARFSQVGLSVSANKELGPRVVVQGFIPQSPDEFMGSCLG